MTTMYNLIDLAGVQFEEVQDTENVSSWIQAMTLGKYRHPEYGKIEFTPERLNKFAESVNSRVTGIVPDIDYDHKSKTDIAAGWVQKAEVRNNGLWILVEWTKKAYQAIKDKEYRYFSPEFVDSWVHPKSGTKFSDVLRGGALTNRPFLKDIAELQLSEITDEGTFMDKDKIKKLAEELGLENPEDATEADVVEALVKEHETPDENEDEDNEDTNENPPANTLSEKEKSKLLSDPITAKLVGILENSNRQLADQEKKFKDIDVESKIAKLSETATTKNVLLPAVTKDKIKKFFAEVDSATSEKALHLMSELITTGVVPAGESHKGGEFGGGENNADAVKRFNDMVSSKMTADKMSFSEAAILVAAEDRELYDAYRVSTYVE